MARERLRSTVNWSEFAEQGDLPGLERELHPSHNARVQALTLAASRLVDAMTRTRGRAWMTVLGALLLALVAGWWGASLRVDTDLKALLPADAPSVRALDQLNARVGSTEQFMVAIEEDDDAQREAMVAALVDEIGGWKETLTVHSGQDYTPLRDHALYFLAQDELVELRDELVAERRRSIAKGMGGFGTGPIDPDAVTVEGDDWETDFADPDPAPNDGGESEGDPEGAGDEGDAPDPTTDPAVDPSPDPSEDPAEDPAADPAPDPAPDLGPGPAADPESDPQPGTRALDLQGWMRDARERLGERSGLGERELDAIWPEHDEAGRLLWPEEVQRPYLSNEGNVHVIKASLTRPATDVSFAASLTTRIENRVAAVRAEGISKKGRVEVVAAYNVSREINVVLRDAKRATMLSAGLVLAVLLLGFRRLRSVVLVVVPMLVATGFTLATARIMVDELNALTVFLFAVLFGMGVDFSVHLYALRQHAPDQSWTTIIERHLRPLASTMLTTAGSLSVLLLADFKAFREFGGISAAGVFICFLAAVFIVPPLETLFPGERSKTASPNPLPAASEPPPRPGPLRWVLLAIVAAVAVYGAPKVSFEKDLRALSVTRKGPAGIRYGSTSSRCSKSVVLVAEDPDELADLTHELDAQREAGVKLEDGAPGPIEEKKPWVRAVYSLSNMMPSSQAPKLPLLEEIAEQANDMLAALDPDDPADDEHRTHLEALETLATTPPMTPETLPPWAREPFTETAGPEAGRSDRIAHLCLGVDTKHIDDLVAVSKRLDSMIGEREILRADSRLVFGDLVSSMERDAKKLPLWAMAVIIAFIAFDLRKVRDTFICFGALILGLGLALGVMGLWPLHFNFFNLVVMPAVIGLSIDASIHLWHARDKATLGATAKASVLAAATTMAGFAGLLVAEHPGLRSIGEVGVSAVAFAVAVAFLALYPGRRR